MHTEFRSENLTKNVYLEDREGCGSVTLRWILGKYIVRMENRRNWFKIVKRQTLVRKFELITDM
jgi:hypothetical protein